MATVAVRGHLQHLLCRLPGGQGPEGQGGCLPRGDWEEPVRAGQAATGQLGEAERGRLSAVAALLAPPPG